jgi:hypothetical protein
LPPSRARYRALWPCQHFFFSQKKPNIAPQNWRIQEYIIIKQVFTMTKVEMEARLAELKKQQGDHFKQKKANRNADSLKAIREEMNNLKDEVTKIYRAK